MSGMSPAARLVLEGIREVLADPIATHELRTLLADLPGERDQLEDRWLDTRSAALHVGMSVDAFKKTMHEIPASQSGPGCKRYFRRSDLDAWRMGDSAGASMPLPRAA